jgi:hypothetical protein
MAIRGADRSPFLYVKGSLREKVIDICSFGNGFARQRNGGNCTVLRLR